MVSYKLWSETSTIETYWVLNKWHMCSYIRPWTGQLLVKMLTCCVFRIKTLLELLRLIVNCIHRNNFKWNMNQNTKHDIEKMYQTMSPGGDFVQALIYSKLVIIMWKVWRMWEVQTVNRWQKYTWWRHGMDTLSVSLALCEGNPPVTAGFTHKRPSNTDIWCFLCGQALQLLMLVWLEK